MMRNASSVIANMLPVWSVLSETASCPAISGQELFFLRPPDATGSPSVGAQAATVSISCFSSAVLPKCSGRDRTVALHGASFSSECRWAPPCPRPGTAYDGGCPDSNISRAPGRSARVASVEHAM